MKIRLFYEAGAGDGSGGTLPPSLADISGGDGNPKPADLTEEAKKQAADAAVAAAEQAAYDALVKEATNEDGTLKEGYIKDEATGKVSKDLNYKPADGDGNDDDGDGNDGDGSENPDDFWADVNKYHGVELKVELPENVDPLSPEGVYHREKQLMQKAVDSFEDNIKKADPRGYAYLLHRQAGGSDEEFFSKKSFSLPEYETFKTDADTQSRVYKASLIEKGLDAETAQVVLDKAIKDGKLFELSDAAYKAAEKAHQDELNAIEKKQQEGQERYNRTINTFNQALTTTITEGKDLQLVIPDAEKPDFLNFLREQVEYDPNTGKLMFVQAIDDKKMARQVEALYVLFKEGNLKNIIKREVQQERRKGLRRAVDKSKEQRSGGADDNNGGNKGGFVPLGSL
jgi:hypothetical protein